MTKQEAIEAIERFRLLAHGHAVLAEALDMAIEALSCSEEPNRSDLIRRQDALDEANAWLLDCFKVQKQDRSCGLIRRLEDLPSANPDLSGYSDRLWKRAYDRGYERCKDDAIDLWDKYHPFIATKAMEYDMELRALPSAQPSNEYDRGWKDGQEALREEIWEYDRDRLD